MNTRPSTPALRGGLLALLAAGLFGLSTPLVQHFGQGLGAFTTAALLYAGAALVALAMRHPPEREAALRRSDLPRLLAMAGFGAVVGPVALAWGLQRTSAVAMPSDAAMRSCESWASSFRRRTSLILRIVILRVSGMPAPTKAGRLPAWGGTNIRNASRC